MGFVPGKVVAVNETLREIMLESAEAIRRGYPLKAPAREQLANLIVEEANTLRPLARVQKVAEATWLQGGG